LPKWVSPDGQGKANKKRPPELRQYFFSALIGLPTEPAFHRAMPCYHCGADAPSATPESETEIGFVSQIRCQPRAALPYPRFGYRWLRSWLRFPTAYPTANKPLNTDRWVRFAKFVLRSIRRSGPDIL
jgi:hypothetical protein